MIRSNEDVEADLRRLEILDSILVTLAKRFSKIHSKNISREHIFDALYLELHNKYDFEHPLDFWGLDIELEEAYKALEQFNFDTVLHHIETEIGLVPRTFLMEYKVQIKSKGLIWQIHKYDPDPFPSNPHAHLIDVGLKLDLSNGKCYRKKKFVHSINRKELEEIRKKAEDYFELPDLKL